RERLMRAEGGRVRYVTHLDIVGDRQPKTLGVARVKSKAAKIDGVVLERPRVMMAVFPSPIPPNSPRFHLRVPEDVVALLVAAGAAALARSRLVPAPVLPRPPLPGPDAAGVGAGRQPQQGPGRPRHRRVGQPAGGGPGGDAPADPGLERRRPPGRGDRRLPEG